MRLFELHGKGETTYTTKHKKLYHLTNANGLGYSVENNALKTLRHSYISTTYNPEMNSFVGGNHYFFKFILDGEALANEYGVYDYQFVTRNGQELKEFEIGVNTKVIEPLSDYLNGVVLIFPQGLFSQQAIMWLIRGHSDRKGFMDASTSKAKPAIRTLAKLMKMGIPIYKGEEGGKFTEKEKQLIQLVWKCYREKVSEDECIERIAHQFDIVDHWGDELSGERYAMERKRPQLEKIFNGYFQNRPIKNVESDDVRKIFDKAMKILGYGGNVVGHIKAMLEKYNMFHPVIPAVEWSIVFKDIIKGDFDEVEDSIKYVTSRNKWSMERFDNGDQSGTHVGTAF